MSRIDESGRLQGEPVRDPGPTIEWIGEGQSGRGGVTIYHGVKVEDTEYEVGDFAYGTPGESGEKAEIFKIIDLYSDKEGWERATVRWVYKPGDIPVKAAKEVEHEREVFLTKDRDAWFCEGIEG